MDKQKTPVALTGLSTQAQKRGVIDTRSIDKRPTQSRPAGQDPQKPFECCICGAGVVDGSWPHNPDPFEGGACCTNCNETQVTPARLLIHSTGLRPPASGITTGGREHTLINLLSNALFSGAADTAETAADDLREVAEIEAAYEGRAE